VAHVKQALAPANAEKLPTAQLVQPEVPEESSYVPAAQLEHALAATPEKLPAAQVEQLVDPVAAW